MNYYISDLHLFHDNSIKFDDRPFTCVEDMHDAIRASWNNKINNGDTVYILGDISFRGKNENLIAYISTLKGKKILVKGNHDDVCDYRYSQLFEDICDYKEVYDNANGTNYLLILSHYPIFSWKRMGRRSIHLYGHTHSGAEDSFYQKCLSDMMENDCRHAINSTPWAINVGCMKPYINYVPRSLKEILNQFKEGK